MAQRRCGHTTNRSRFWMLAQPDRSEAARPPHVAVDLASRWSRSAFIERRMNAISDGPRPVSSASISSASEVAKAGASSNRSAQLTSSSEAIRSSVSSDGACLPRSKRDKVSVSTPKRSARSACVSANALRRAAMLRPRRTCNASLSGVASCGASKSTNDVECYPTDMVASVRPCRQNVIC